MSEIAKDGKLMSELPLAVRRQAAAVPRAHALPAPLAPCYTLSGYDGLCNSNAIEWIGQGR